jgi:hypothetical protein
MSGKEDKYGDDTVFEPWFDNNLFFPIASKLVDPLYSLGLTPNMVTIISTMFTFMSIYFMEQNNSINAALSYFTGYMLDCVDGRMARKYSMGSDVGMALDFTSDTVSNSILYAYLIYRRKITIEIFIVLLIFSILISLAFSINEAIAYHKLSGSDNFYQRRVIQLKDKMDNKMLFDLYLATTKSTYDIYRMFFPTYDEDKMKRWLILLKEFGPGTYCMVVTSILICI